MEAYLDNAATTAVEDNVAELMIKVMKEDFGNPSSKHIKGMQGENYIKDAAATIASSLKVLPKEITFTSGGTEANNLALIGGAYANIRAGKHIISTVFEHASVYNPLLYLKDMGFEITFVGTDRLGHINVDELLDAIREDTIIISMMYVNNEIGSITNLEEIIPKIREKKKNVIIHVDAIQGYGKFKIFPKKIDIDMMSVSGHKIHGPKGSGFLYVRDKVKIKPIIFGGGQQKGLRSGTENVPSIAGLALAAKNIYTDYDKKINHLYELKECFVENVLKVPDITINAIDLDGIVESEGQIKDFEKFKVNIRKTAPHIVSVSFKNIRSEVLLHALEDKGVYVSSGSACSSNHPSLSGTLQAIGVEKELLDSTLRFSFSFHTTKEELIYACQCLQEITPVLKKYVRR
ncbi:MAG: cysteine desulfurase [Lachnospiraceae bacterium]|nr:cysteine desulfurase [Lachnospiraceae bacterium]